MDRDEFIKSNLSLAHSLANRFRNRGIEYEELYQAGCLGLVKAVDGFNEELGFRFSTYAVPVILGEIKKLFRDSGTVKISRSLREKARDARNSMSELEAKLGREPSISELAESLGMSEYETAQLLAVTAQPVSLSFSDSDGEERQLDIPSQSREEEIAGRIDLSCALDSLNSTDRKLIELRYFSGLTQAVTAEKLGLTQVQVSRRERALLTAMRRKLTG